MLAVMPIMGKSRWRSEQQPGQRQSSYKSFLPHGFHRSLLSATPLSTPVQHKSFSVQAGTLT
jgi:hypothetical protein